MIICNCDLDAHKIEVNRNFPGITYPLMGQNALNPNKLMKYSIWFLLVFSLLDNQLFARASGIQRLAGYPE